MISEHHFDYSPHDLKPLGVEIQLGHDFTVLDQTAKQIWWSTSSFKPKKIQTGVKTMEVSSDIQGNTELGFFNDHSGQSTFYTAPWKQSSLLTDVIGLHFYTVTQFEVPKDYTIVDAYIQGQNPHLSEQLSYEIGKND